MRWEKPGPNRRFAGIPNPWIDVLPFQKGALILASKDEGPQDIEDLCREILMVRISEIPDPEDDSLERVSLGDYNSDDFDEYHSDHMDSTPVAMTEIKTSFNQDPSLAPPSVTVTVKLEDEQEEMDLYKRRSILNQKRALRRKRATTHHQEHRGDSFDYSNSDLRNVINIGRDARNVIISRRQEREKVEAYCPTSNYHIPDDYPRLRKLQHLHDDREAAYHEDQQEKVTYRQEQREKMQAAQERFI